MINGGSGELFTTQKREPAFSFQVRISFENGGEGVEEF